MKWHRTLISEKMRQYVALVNSIYLYRTQAEVALLARYPESSMTIFDVYSLVSNESSSTSSAAAVKKMVYCLPVLISCPAGGYMAQPFRLPQRDRHAERDVVHHGLW